MMAKEQPDEALPTEVAELLADRRLIIASSRGPYTFLPQADGRLAVSRCGGGLVTAMMCVAEASAATWICAASTPHDRAIAQREPSVGLPPGNPLFEMRLLPIAEDVYDRYYNVVANPLLWFIQHYLWDLMHEPAFDSSTLRAWTEGYVAFNETFAKAIAAECQTSNQALVMLQDYHLFLCPTMLRAHGCDARLIHFTHIPWPQPDYFRVLPVYMRSAILRGLLDADVVGFHTARYVQNFLWTCHQLGAGEVDFDCRRVVTERGVTHVRAYPISITADSIRALAASDDVQERLQPLSESVGNRKVIVRADRADPTKNVLRGFEAYRLLLRSHPELTGRVEFLAMLYASRTSIPQYRRYVSEIETLVESINSEFGTDNWQPIRLRIADDYHESLAAMCLYDVLLVNPVFDGMNLVAKEGPSINKRAGVLVLSENAGAFDEMSDACLGVNPFDCGQTADALYAALTMSERERTQRATRLREIVDRNDSVKWLYHQLKDADDLAEQASSSSRSTTSVGPST